MKYGRIEIYPTANKRWVIRTDTGETFAFERLDEVIAWLKDNCEK